MPAAPVSTGRSRFDIGELIREHGPALEAATHVSPAQRRVLLDLAQCRTAALGGHIDFCPACGYEHPSYNSCRNRHCPKCQALAQEEWIEAREARLLPVRHFHVVFTLPRELRPLAQAHRAAVFDTLFTCVNEALQELGQSRLGGTLGATLILHTWTRTLEFHPHIHAIVTGGALSKNGRRWKSAGKKFLFPVRALGKLLRGKMLDHLRRQKEDGAFEGAEHFEQLCRAAARHKVWHVYAKASFRTSEKLLKYLGRYTHRVGISNSRLVDVTKDEIVFRTKGRKTARLAPVEFLRRFIQHFLPPGFCKIRHIGLYASALAATKYVVARQKLVVKARPVGAMTARVEAETWQERLRRLTGRDVTRCPRCTTPLLSIDVPRPPRAGIRRITIRWPEERGPPTEVACA